MDPQPIYLVQGGGSAIKEEEASAFLALGWGGHCPPLQLNTSPGLGRVWSRSQLGYRGGRGPVLPAPPLVAGPPGRQAGRQRLLPAHPSRASGINPALEQATHPLPLPLWPPPCKQERSSFWRPPRREEGRLKTPSPPPFPAIVPLQGEAVCDCPGQQGLPRPCWSVSWSPTGLAACQGSVLHCSLDPRGAPG